MENIVDIFRTIVGDMGQTIKIDSVTNNSNGTYTLALPHTKWLRPYVSSDAISASNRVTINSTTYPISAMVYNTSITVVSSSDLSSYTELSIEPPFYFNGTQLAVNKDRGNIQFKWTKLPFVWLVEPFRANESSSKMDVFSSKPNLTFFWLDNQNKTDWTTQQHYEYVILPMSELVEAFKKKIIANKLVFNKVSDWQTMIHVKFGEVSKVGHISSIIDENTSGIEVSFSVEILRDCYC